MKKIMHKYIVIIILFLLNSCTEIIDVEVPNGGERLVVEASILWQRGTQGNNQQIKLSKSTGFFDTDKFNPATGANVTVTNLNTNEVFLFTDEGNGVYETQTFVPIINNTYELNINYDQKTYTAVENLIEGPEITRVEQKIVNSVFNGEELSVLAYYQDKENVENFYLAEYKNSRFPLIDLEPTDDENFDGNENFAEYDGETLEVGDVVTLTLHGISSNYFYYIDLLSSQQQTGGVFQTTPVRLKGNCINPNDLSEEVLGFFRLNQFDRVEHIVQ